MSYRADKLVIDGHTDTHTHTHTHAGNNNSRRPKLASGKKQNMVGHSHVEHRDIFTSNDKSIIWYIFAGAPSRIFIICQIFSGVINHIFYCIYHINIANPPMREMLLHSKTPYSTVTFYPLQTSPKFSWLESSHGHYMWTAIDIYSVNIIGNYVYTDTCYFHRNQCINSSRPSTAYMCQLIGSALAENGL